MHKNWDDLKYVMALGRAGSMAAAAKMLHTSSTTVSRKVMSVTEEYNQPLFMKQQHSWALTEFGQSLFDVAEELERALSTVEQDGVQDDKVGELMITSLDFLNRTVLFPRLSEFHVENPNLTVTLHNSDENLSLAYGEADVAIRMARPTSGRLNAMKLFTLKYAIYCPVGGNCAEWVGLDEKVDWVPEVKMAKEFFDCAPAFRVTDYKGLRDAMSKLKIASFLPEIMACEEPNLEQVPGSPTVEREVWLVTHDSRRNDVKVKIAKEWIKSCFDQICLEKTELPMQPPAKSHVF